jgi:hypothetical protein
VGYNVKIIEIKNGRGNKMGAYYTLGLIQRFTARSERALSEEKWKQLLNERVNLELFEIEFTPDQVNAVLKEKIFEDNIEDFYCKLKKITHDNGIDYYFTENGTQRDNYDWDRTRVYFCNDENEKIAMHVLEYTSLFTEGKVLAEEFSIEPKLINWLFRHCDFGNCLAGAIISTIN